MESFSDYSVWGWMLIFAILLSSMLAGNILKKGIPFLRESLIPTSVLGGAILVIVAAVYKWIAGTPMFEAAIFGGRGTSSLEIITYHALALGFIASAFKTNGGKLTKKRNTEIFNTGVTTVSTYLVQGILGLVITVIAALIIKDFFAASGLLAAFGYGQGTGQALTYGAIYEEISKESGGSFGGKNFALVIAAMGFISASLGGVIHLNVMKKLGRLRPSSRTDGSLHTDELESSDEIPMQESMDKMTVQIALIAVAYLFAYFLMFALAKLIPSMTSVIYGFNFLVGVLTATLIKVVLNFLRKKGIMKKKYPNNFLMARTSNFFFDLMVVSGVAAIRLDDIQDYWGVLLILGVTETVATYLYNRFVAKTLFSDYSEEQFLAMYGMLTGTASTGIILLREIDGDFKTPAADNLVYQNFFAIMLGFPIIILARLAPENPFLCLGILIGLFIVMNVILFRSRIFRRKSFSKGKTEEREFAKTE